MTIVNPFDLAPSAARTGKSIKSDAGLAHKTVSDIFDDNQIVIQPVNVDGTSGGDSVTVFVLPTN